MVEIFFFFFLFVKQNDHLSFFFSKINLEETVHRDGSCGGCVPLLLTASDDLIDTNFFCEIPFVMSKNFNSHNSDVGEEHEGGDLTVKMMVESNFCHRISSSWCQIWFGRWPEVRKMIS